MKTMPDPADAMKNFSEQMRQIIHDSQNGVSDALGEMSFEQAAVIADLVALSGDPDFARQFMLAWAETFVDSAEYEVELRDYDVELLEYGAGGWEWAIKAQS